MQNTGVESNTTQQLLAAMPESVRNILDAESKTESFLNEKNKTKHLNN